jgi:hypothetical protein
MALIVGAALAFTVWVRFVYRRSPRVQEDPGHARE